MKAFYTTYTKTDEGLKLRNNFAKELMSYDLKEELMKYIDSLEELSYQVVSINNSLNQRGYSSIIEGVNSEGTVIHVRFSS